ncbi:MAG: serine protease [Elusimicrobia bacterium]|nr:serine protease [Elusimicrobiota bacterium]
MRRPYGVTLTAAALAVLLAAGSAAAGDKSIYGADDRRDYYELTPAQRALADSTVSLWDAEDVEQVPGGALLNAGSFGETYGLCPGVRFAEQPSGAYCSGALVGEDLVLTAGHCVTSVARCAETRVVFGFAVKREGGSPATVLPAGEVYSCAGIVARLAPQPPGPGIKPSGADYAVIRLDRRAAGHAPLPVNRGAGPRPGDGLFIIGHPAGLPLKLADGAAVRDASGGEIFTADLDAFGGNSGSPAFNARTRLIEGVLTRGGNDFLDTPQNCLVPAVYPQNGGRGEDVTRVQAAAAFIPLLPAEAGQAR